LQEGYSTLYSAIATYFHLFGNFYIWLISFIVGFVAMVAGSILPDLDAPRSPVHDNLLVFVGILIAMVIQGFGPAMLAILVAPQLSVYLDRNHLPRHRGFVHTIRAGLILDGIGGLLMQILFHNIWLSVWTLSSLFLGHCIHLVKDSWIRF
jgi:hypothetical protein